MTELTSPDDPASSQDPRVARTHADVAEAVSTLFLEEGWDAITHQRVAERAGYGRNTIYRHFPDRTALLAHGGRYADVHHAEVTGDLRRDLIAELQTFRRELYDGIVGQIMAAMVERAHRDPEIEPVLERLVQQGAGQTADLVRAAIAEGRATDQLSVAEHVAVLCGPLVYARFCLYEPPADSLIEHLVDQTLDAGG